MRRGQEANLLLAFKGIRGCSVFCTQWRENHGRSPAYLLACVCVRPGVNVYLRCGQMRPVPNTRTLS